MAWWLRKMEIDTMVVVVVVVVVIDDHITDIPYSHFGVHLRHATVDSMIV